MKSMMIISKIRQLDTRLIHDFKETYLKTPEEGFSERIQMTTFAVASILITLAHELIYMIAIFSASSIFFSTWAIYTWRTFYILTKEGKNMDEPFFIYGPVSPLRICAFIPAVIFMFLLFIMPRMIPAMPECTWHKTVIRPISILYSIALSIVMVEFIRFVGAHKNWNLSRHFMYVFLLMVVSFIYFVFITHRMYNIHYEF